MIPQDTEVAIEAKTTGGKMRQEKIAMALGLKLVYLSELKNVIRVSKAAPFPERIPKGAYICGFEEVCPKINHITCKALRDGEVTLLFLFPTPSSKKWNAYLHRILHLLDHFSVRYLFVSLSDVPEMMSSRVDKESFIRMILEKQKLV